MQVHRCCEVLEYKRDGESGFSQAINVPAKQDRATEIYEFAEARACVRTVVGVVYFIRSSCTQGVLLILPFLVLGY